MSIVTTTVVLPARLAPGDSRRLLSMWRASVTSWFLAALRALAFLSVRDLMRSVDRTLGRSLLARSSRRPLTEVLTERGSPRQPADAWTINRKRLAPLPIADGRATAFNGMRALGAHDNLTSPSADCVESPTIRMRADSDEARVIDQRGASRDARRDLGGRRAG